MQTPSCHRMMANPSEIESLLQSTIGTLTKLVDCQWLKHDQDYCVLFARLSHPSMSVVIKLAGPNALMASQFDRTAAIHRLVAECTTIPVPVVIAMDVSCQLWPWRYLICTALPGTEWSALRSRMSEAELVGAYWQIGEAIAQLHQIAFSAFGEIDDNGQVAGPGLSFPDALRTHAKNIIRNPRLQEAFLAAFEQHLSWFEGVTESRLCHEDLHGHNILFARQSGDWRLAAILDFDKAWAGHPETDLARLEFWRGMTAPAFWQAYKRFQLMEDGYVHRRPIYQLLWCLEYARQTPEHLEDTRRVCRELDIPLIERFD